MLDILIRPIDGHISDQQSKFKTVTQRDPSSAKIHFSVAQIVTFTTAVSEKSYPQKLSVRRPQGKHVHSWSHTFGFSDSFLVGKKLI